MLEYRKVRFTVVRSADPGGWKWVVTTDAGQTKRGFKATRVMAVRAAKMAVDKLLLDQQMAPVKPQAQRPDV